MAIRSFRHKGLRHQYEKGDPRGVPAALVRKLKRMLTLLDTAVEPDDMSLYPGWRLHQLKGDLDGFWSLTASGYWRLIFGSTQVRLGTPTSWIFIEAGSPQSWSNTMAMADPSHPGDILKEDVLVPLGLSVTRAAGILGVTRPALSAVLNGRAALSAEMALRIEKAFGPRADHLLRVQLSHELARGRRREAEITAGIRRYEPSAA